MALFASNLGQILGRLMNGDLAASPAPQSPPKIVRHIDRQGEILELVKARGTVRCADLVHALPPTIKPDDLVRTPSGATGTVEDILPDGRRRVRLLDGERVELLPHLLYVVRSAVPRPWSRHTL
jgi:hypothetical protein